MNEKVLLHRKQKTIFLYVPILDSINLAVTDVAPLAEYTPKASKERPPAAVRTLSQSVSIAWAPVPMTPPAVLYNK